MTTLAFEILRSIVVTLLALLRQSLLPWLRERPPCLILKLCSSAIWLEVSLNNAGKSACGMCLGKSAGD